MSKFRFQDLEIWLIATEISGMKNNMKSKRLKRPESDGWCVMVDGRWMSLTFDINN